MSFLNYTIFNQGAKSAAQNMDLKCEAVSMMRNIKDQLKLIPKRST